MAAASSVPPSAAVQRQPNGLVEVVLRGAFAHPHWLAYLLRGLAEREVSLMAGRATQIGEQDWDARVVLDFRASQLQPEGLDYVTLAHQRMDMAALAAPQLGSFRITRRPDLQLEVLVEAPDQVGFLGRLLTRVSSLGLFPSEMEIATVNGRIKDRIVLRGILSKVPTETVHKSLEAMFRLMTPGRASAPAATTEGQSLSRPA